MLVQDPRAYLRYAYEQHFAMPAFNVCNLEMVRAVIDAATIEKAPVIVQTYTGDLAHSALGDDHNIGPLPEIIKQLAKLTPVPVFLHMDHGPSLEFDTRCLQRGYSSVMFDGHGLPFDQAVAETAAIARVAHAMGSAVEGEVGSFGGHQGDQIFTDPDDALRMFQEGQADMLAVSVGSEHGQASRLNMHLLRAIYDKTHGPLVIHGGSGVHEDDVRAAVQMGVVKINIGTALSRAWCKACYGSYHENIDNYGMLKAGMDAVREEARRRLKMMGASGQAR